MDSLPLYKADHDYVDLQALPFLTRGCRLKGLPEKCYEVSIGDSKAPAPDDLYRFDDVPDTDKLIQRFYRLGEVYALAYMHRLYTNHHHAIFEDIKAHLQGELSINDVWGEGDLHMVVEAFKVLDCDLPKYIGVWIESGFFDALNRFLIMSILPKNSMMDPSIKLSKITPDDINAMIEAVLHDKAPPNFPFQPFEGWAIGAQ